MLEKVSAAETRISVLNPMGFPPKVARKTAAPRVSALDGDDGRAGACADRVRAAARHGQVGGGTARLCRRQEPGYRPAVDAGSDRGADQGADARYDAGLRPHAAAPRAARHRRETPPA